ncbi:thiamine phosphate synthase [Sandaracinobacteroides saxicola]|uniref:Thiamine phosphate synthase n=1 Tax=Sandaracinobacteroides saxicola TaxID=2759707 RepID=A0A7G5IHM6_9SPHN|nr:thiamine phosphate synthase [Sandaracinobacteroides saxicola]QMW22868.1 thiamine phosphate synthase [Sandaracinobacteroides saxicola]
MPLRNWPRHWLFTDERLGDSLSPALARLPPGAGIVLRHYSLPPAGRLALARRIVKARPDLLLVIAGEPLPLPSLTHVPRWSRRAPARPFTASAHTPRELSRALLLGAGLIFLSPVFATRSHPGARALGPMRFATLARRSPVPVIALGGMTPARQHRLAPLGSHGFAAIDFWAR